MQRGSFSHKNYGYSHHDQKGPSQAIDVHDIFVKKSKTRVILSYVGIFVFLANACYSLLVKEELSTSSFWSIFVGVLFAKCLQYKPVKKESVVIMPTFGVQLETHFWRMCIFHTSLLNNILIITVISMAGFVLPTYGLKVLGDGSWSMEAFFLQSDYVCPTNSGRVIHRFVPIGKILRPVLNECVTPVTCYWSLALMLRGEENLLLIFQELQPPVKMLVPVWKALCAATNGKEISSS